MEQKLRIGKPNVNIIEASGEITITENGNYDVRQFGTAIVDIQSQDTILDTSYLKKMLDRSIESLPEGVLNGVEKIGDCSFYKCSKLTEITISSSIKSIGYESFSYSGLDKITFSEGLESIENRAFFGCFFKNDVIFPESLKSINGDETFWNAIYSTRIAPNAYTENGLLILSGWILRPAYSTNSNITGELTISEGIVGIAGLDSRWDYGTFTNCTSITLPKSLKHISNYAFSFCDSITSFRFLGTTSDWANITLGTGWNYGSTITSVICSDGTITL